MRVFPCLPLISPSLLRWRLSSPALLMLLSTVPRPTASALREHVATKPGLNAVQYDWLLRGCKRTFSPFHRGVVTTYALEVGAAGDGDYRDHSFSAFRAARCLIHGALHCLIHGTLPISQP